MFVKVGGCDCKNILKQFNNNNLKKKKCFYMIKESYHSLHDFSQFTQPKKNE